MHYHSQNLTDGRLPKWRYGRAWLGSLSWGWSIFYRTNLCLAKIGARGFAVYFFWFGFYLSWSRREDDGEFCRHFEVSIHDGKVWIEHPWVRADEWRSRDPWWRKQIVLRVGDWIFGKQRCEVTKGAPVEVFVPMPEGSYRAIATPETRIWRRRFYVPMRRRDDVWIDIPGGIPFAGKGENSWDCDDDGLFGTGGDTVDDAIANCVRSALRQRRRRGHDIHGTGKVPATIVNAKELCDVAKKLAAAEARIAEMRKVSAKFHDWTALTEEDVEDADPTHVVSGFTDMLTALRRIADLGKGGA